MINQIFNEDCIIGIKRIPDNYIDLVIIDPPYMKNIAVNADSKKAVEAWMNSESHKNNILNNAYNYTGVAVVSSSKYGKIFVQMFIGK